ncbi:MAG: bifunctional 4-hydroxy-2-oxoglutarate aldolase/2-dehydro-3-deoxy-phosphogluconate aldolase [Candidatus Marinimicrobia bacterium]|nr:bifunctional 4-hydroxy-2-oxoglutarate aldolase/2-dehydro-3-deoxy-phosphogluconate aldolase [Candidatus Neomarinimicrobiota bacterium]
MHDILTQLERFRVIPVVALQAAESANALGDALRAGGLPCAEVTFRTASAAAIIKTLAARGDLLVGAGTVLKVDQVKAAVDGGAAFIVAPGFNPKVVSYCVAQGIPVTPGVCTPTEIEMALDHGLEVLKFFPAETFGGLKALKALSAPYGQVRFIPTGGITAENLPAYLAFPKVLACGGSWMVAGDLLQAGRFEEVTRLTRLAVKAAQSANGAA